MDGDAALLHRLRELDARAQERFVLESSAGIPTETLVAALAELGADLGRLAEIQITDVVADRGELDTVARVLLELPVGSGSDRLGSDRLAMVLFRMSEVNASLRAPILRTLAEAVDRALTAGAGTWGAGVLLETAAEVAVSGDPGNEAAAAARRYLEVAGEEVLPYTPGLNSAHSLLAAAGDR